MDGAQASGLCSAVDPSCFGLRVGWRGGREKALGVSPRRTAASADLGGSSKYSNENFED